MIRVFETIAQEGIIRLPSNAPSEAHCVVTILDSSLDELRVQSQLELPETAQRRMSELLLKNRDGSLTGREKEELDSLVEEFDAATLAKGRALAALAQLGDGSNSG